MSPEITPQRGEIKLRRGWVPLRTRIVENAEQTVDTECQVPYRLRLRRE